MVTNAYPEDIEGNPHADGQIWSAALWRIFEAIGRDASLRLVVGEPLFPIARRGTCRWVIGNSYCGPRTEWRRKFRPHLGNYGEPGFFTRPNLALDAFEDNDTAETAATVELPYVNEELSIHEIDNDDYYKFRLDETMQVWVGN